MICHAFSAAVARERQIVHADGDDSELVCADGSAQSPALGISIYKHKSFRSVFGTTESWWQVGEVVELPQLEIMAGVQIGVGTTTRAYGLFSGSRRLVNVNHPRRS